MKDPWMPQGRRNRSVASGAPLTNTGPSYPTRGETMTDREALDEAIAKKWGNNSLIEVRRLSYNSAMLYLEHGPMWRNKGGRAAVDYAVYLDNL